MCRLIAPPGCIRAEDLGYDGMPGKGSTGVTSG
jgi:hypothetical protein